MIITYHPNRGLDRPTKGFRTRAVSSLVEAAQVVAQSVWSPVVYRDGHRLEAGYLESFFAALDFDDGEYSLEQAVSDFAGTRHIIATTKSHRIAKGDKPAVDRFRVVVPWTEPIPILRVYRWNMHRLTRKYAADRACVDGARFFYPCREIISINDDAGDELEPVDYFVPSAFERERSGLGSARVDRLQRSGRLPSFADYWLRFSIPVGKRNTYCYAIAKELTQIGMPLEEIRERIFASATYRGASLSPALVREIEEATANGARAGEKAKPRR